VVLSDEIEGDMLIDVLPREGYNKGDNVVEKVIIGLHGVTGTSRDGYLLDLAFESSHRGYNMVAFNHFAPAGCKNLRLMDLCENKHVDEVIQFAK
jgi:predicted alpha/beta-fold hydrolase